MFIAWEVTPLDIIYVQRLAEEAQFNATFTCIITVLNVLREIKYIVLCWHKFFKQGDPKPMGHWQPGPTVTSANPKSNQEPK